MADRVRIAEGWGYKMYDPQDFRRSDGTVVGTVYETKGSKVWLRLDSGRYAETEQRAIESIEEEG